MKTSWILLGAALALLALVFVTTWTMDGQPEESPSPSVSDPDSDESAAEDQETPTTSEEVTPTRAETAVPPAPAGPTGDPATRTVTGRVLDARDDRPIPGARVVVTRDHGSWQEWDEVQRQVTDAEGRFGWCVDPGAHERVHVEASKPGFVSAGANRVTVEVGAPELVLRLWPGVPVTGEVRFGPGQPVAGGHGFVALDLLAQANRSPGQGHAAARYSTEVGGRFALDEEGRFAITVPAGRVAFEVYGPTFAPAFSEVVDLAPDSEQHVVIPVLPSYVLDGTVVSADGTPVEGALVSVMAAIPDRYPDHLYYQYSERLTATSGADGSVRIPGMPEQYRSLSVTHPDFTALHRYNIEERSDEPVHLTLEPCQWIEGSLRDENGQTVEDCPAHLQLQRSLALEWLPGGRFRSAGLEKGVGSGSLIVDGYPPVPLTWEPGTGARDVGEVSLAPGDLVTLTIRNAEEEPLEGCTVEVSVEQGPGGRPVAVHRIRSDAEGQAESRAVGGVVARVSVEKQGFAPWTTSYDVDGKPHELEVVLVRDATLIGVIADAKGDPLPHAQVRVYGEEPAKRWTEAVETLPDGRFEIGGVPGDVALRIWVSQAVGHPDLQKDLPPVGAGETVDLGAVVLDEGRTITGQVTDQEGRPVPEVVVSVQRRTNSFSTGFRIDPWAESGPDGRFLIRGLVAGDYSVMGTWNGVESSPEEATVTESMSDDVTLTLELGPSAEYSGVVRNEDGEPVVEASIDIGAERGGWKWGRSRADGRFVLTSVPAEGPLTVRISHEEYKETRLEVDSFAELPEELVLERGAGLALRLTVRGGRALPSYVRVHLIGRSLNWSRSAPVEDGWIRISGLREASVDVLLEASGFPLGEGGEVDLVDGRQEEREVVLEGRFDPIELRILDQDGAPLQGAMVRFFHGPRRRSFFHSPRTDDRGVVHSSAPLTPGMQMEVSAIGYRTVSFPDANELVDGEGRIQVRLVREGGLP